MALDNGSGVILTKGVEISTYLILNDESLQFSNFYVTDENDTNDYAIMTNPSGALNNILESELIDIGSPNYLPNVVYTGVVVDNGQYLQTADGTIVPISCTIPAGTIGANKNLKNIYVCAKDKEIVVALVVASLTGFSKGDTVTGALSGVTATVADAVQDAGGDNLVYVKGVSGVFTIGETVNSSGGGSQAITDFKSESLLIIPLNTNYIVGEIVIGNTSGATGTIYSKIGATQLVLYNVEGTFEVGEVIEGLSSSTLQNLSNKEDTNMSFLYYAGFFQQDTTGPTIETITYIDSGYDIVHRINLTRTSGMPTNVNFNNTRAVEISEHNNDGSAHDIRTTQNLTYTGGVDFSNATQLQAIIDALPREIRHKVTIDGNSLNLAGGNINLRQASTVSTPALEGTLPSDIGFTGGGKILIKDITGVNVMNVSDCMVELQIDNITFTANASETYALYCYNSKHVNVFNCNFSGAGANTYVNAIGSAQSRIYADTNTMGNAIATAVTNGIYAFRASEVYSKNWTVDKAVTGYNVRVSGGAKVKYLDENQILSSKTSDDIFEYVEDGSEIIGVFGNGSLYRDSAPARDITISLSGTDTAYEIKQKVDVAGKHIPYGSSLIVEFADTSGQFDLGADAIIFSGFYGGGDLQLIGNGGASSLNTYANLNSDYVATTGARALLLENNRVKIYVDNLALAAYSTSQAMEIINCDNVYVRYSNIRHDDAGGASTLLVGVQDSKVVFVDTHVSRENNAVASGNFIICNNSDIYIENCPYDSTASFFEVSGNIITAQNNSDIGLYDSQPKSTVDLTTLASLYGSKIQYGDYLYINNKTLTAV